MRGIGIFEEAVDAKDIGHQQGSNERSSMSSNGGASSPGPSRTLLSSRHTAEQHGIKMEHHGAAYNYGAVPRVPLRVPQKILRRSWEPDVGLPHHVFDEAPVSPSTVTSMSHMSQVYAGDAVPFRGTDRTSRLLATRDFNEKQYIAHRDRDQNRRFLLIVGIAAVVVILALAIGLGVGLGNKVSTQGVQADQDGASGTSFPAGSYSIKTVLQKVDSGCTSKNTTWSCGSLHQGDSSITSWDIAQLNASTYTVTSNGGPFGVDVKNTTLTVRDPGQLTERLEFSFLTNKTVVPSDAGSPTNRAAKCTYADTIFKAAFYTRRRANAAIPSQNRVQSSVWPGDVTISQSLASTVGQPVCRDAANYPIADVATGAGACLCEYTN